MKRASILVFCSIFVAILATAPAVQAGGFGLFEWGNKAISMGTANYAVGDDASVLAYNPALMTQFDEIQVLAGVAAIAPSSDVNIKTPGGIGTAGDYATKPQTFMVPHAYYVHPATDKVTLGVGAFTRFGLGTEFEDNWGGRTMIQEILLESVSIQPTMAVKATDDLSLAAGVEIMKGSMYLKKAAGAAAAQTVAINVDGVSVGGVLGVDYKFNEEWNVGFTYRTPVNFTGGGSVDGSGAGLGKGDATVSAVFPSSYTVGLGYNPMDDLTLEFSVVHTRWELFDYMSFDYENIALNDNDDPFYYKNTWRFQLGAEYELTDMFALRAGYVYDQTPTRHDFASPMLPANDRMLYSLGLGIKGEQWFCDLSAMYITTKERKGVSKTAADGTYKYDTVNGRTIVSGVSVGYNF